MGQRAVITNLSTKTKTLEYKNLDQYLADSLAVYVHWLGERRYIDAFMHYCRLQEFRTPKQDPEYAYARLAQVIANYTGDSTGVGVMAVRHIPFSCLDPGDDGVYLIEGWNVEAHYRTEYGKYSGVGEFRLAEFDPEIDDYTPEEMDELLLEIDRRQPEHMQLGDKVLKWRTN